MQRAQKRAAVTEQKFWFRKQVYPFGGDASDHRHGTPQSLSPPASPTSSGTHFPNGVGGAQVNGRAPTEKAAAPSQSRCPSPHSPTSAGDVEEEYEEMTINEVINGNVRATLYHHYIGSFDSRS